MRTYDLCANTVTLSIAQRDFANQALWGRLKQVDELYDRHGASGNLYLGGSVGLHQPSLRVRGGVATALKSDLDLYYLCRNFPPGPEDRAFLESVSALPDDVEVSVHVLPAVTLDQPTYSSTLDDLCGPLTRPLRQTFPFTNPSTAPTYESKTIMTYAIRMLGSALVTSYVATHQYANLPGDVVECDPSTAVKSALVFLRLPCYAALGPNYSHRSLLEYAETDGFAGICAADFVHQLLRHREQVDSERQLPELDLTGLFTATMGRHLGLPLTTTPVDVARAVVERYLSEAGTLEVLHRLLLAHGLWLLNPDEQEQQFAQEQLAGSEDLELEISPRLQEVYRNRDLELGRRVCSDLISLCMKSITDRVATLVAQALQKNSTS